MKSATTDSEPHLPSADKDQKESKHLTRLHWLECFHIAFILLSFLSIL